MFRLREATAYGLLALSRFDTSFPSWVVFGLHAAFTFWQIHPNKRRRAIKMKSKRRDCYKSESSEEDTNPFPPWFYLPNEEQISWANRRLVKLWPHFGALVKRFMHETVEIELQEDFGDIYVHEVTVGDNGPVIEAVELHFQESVIKADIILNIIYTGDLGIILRTKQMPDDFCFISDFKLQGALKVAFEPRDPNDEQIHLAEAKMSFLSSPDINFDMNLLGKRYHVNTLSKLKDNLIGRICEAVKSNLVEPNQMRVPLFEGYDPTELVYHIPQGVFRMNLSELNTDFSAEHGPLDVHIEVQICDRKFRSKLENSRKSFEAVVDNPSSQGVKIDLIKKPLCDGQQEDKIGRFQSCIEDLIKRTGDKIYVSIEIGSEIKEVLFDYSWLDVSQPTDLPVSVSENFFSILIVKLVSGDITVPTELAPDKQLKVIIKTTLGTETQETVPLLAEHVVWDEELRFVVKNSIEKELDFEIVDKASGKILGRGKYDVMTLINKENEGMDVHMPLYTNKGKHSILTCRFLLIPLVPIDDSQDDFQKDNAMDDFVMLGTSHDELVSITKKCDVDASQQPIIEETGTETVQQSVAVVGEKVNGFVVLEYCPENEVPDTEQTDVEGVKKSITEKSCAEAMQESTIGGSHIEAKQQTKIWENSHVLESGDENLHMEQNDVEVAVEPCQKTNHNSSVKENHIVINSERRQFKLNNNSSHKEDNQEPTINQELVHSYQQSLKEASHTSLDSRSITNEIHTLADDNPIKNITETKRTFPVRQELPGAAEELEQQYGFLEEQTVTGDKNTNARQEVYANLGFVQEKTNLIISDMLTSGENANSHQNSEDLPEVNDTSSEQVSRNCGTPGKQNYVIVERTIKEETIRILLEEHCKDDAETSLVENNVKSRNGEIRDEVLPSKLLEDIPGSSQEMKETAQRETRLLSDMNTKLSDSKQRKSPVHAKNQIHSSDKLEQHLEDSKEIKKEAVNVDAERNKNSPVAVKHISVEKEQYDLDVVGHEPSVNTAKSSRKKRSSKTGTVFGLFGRTKDSTEETQGNIIVSENLKHTTAGDEVNGNNHKKLKPPEKDDYFYFGDSLAEEPTEEFSCLYMRYTEVSPDEKFEYQINTSEKLGENVNLKGISGDDVLSRIESNNPTRELQENFQNVVLETTTGDSKLITSADQQETTPVKIKNTPEGVEEIEKSCLGEEAGVNANDDDRQGQNSSKKLKTKRTIPVLKVSKSQQNLKNSAVIESDPITTKLTESKSQQNLHTGAMRNTHNRITPTLTESKSLHTLGDSYQKDSRRKVLSTPNLSSTPAVSGGKDFHRLKVGNDEKAETTSLHSYTGSQYDLHSWAHSSDKIDIRGEIMLTLKYNHVSNFMTVIVHSARELVSRDLSAQTNPRVRVYLLPERSSKSRRETETMKGTLNPAFNTTFEYPVGLQLLKNRQLDIAVKNEKSRLFGKHSRELLGHVVIDLCKVDLSTGVTNWFTLKK